MVIIMISMMSLVISGCGNKKKGIVAEVNGDVITEEEFNQEFEVTKKMYQKQLGEDILSQETEDNKTYEEVLKENILEMLINEKIISNDMEKLNITVTDEEVNEIIKNNYINQLGGEEKYKEFLKNNGFTEDFFKKNIKKAIMYQKHKEDFLNKTKLSEDEIKKYFEANKESLIKVRISHILVKTEEEGKKVLGRLKNGEDFHSLAVTQSMDSKSAAQGGDLGYYTRGKMVKEFKELENAAFSLKVGEISEPIKTDLGYHIILVEDRKDSYKDLKDDTIKALKDEKYLNKISELRDKADIKTYLEEDKNKEKDK